MQQTIWLPTGFKKDCVKYTFFVCWCCDVEDAIAQGKRVLRLLLDAEIDHYCDDCGGQLSFISADKARPKRI